MSNAELAERLFPEAFAGDSSYHGIGYGDIAAKIGEVLIEESDDDYSGSSYYLLKDGERYGYLEFGWGSCSGCDALEACDTKADLGHLFVSLRDSVHWEASLDAMLAWFVAHDWRGSWSWHDGCRKFVKALNRRFSLGISTEERE